MKPYHFLKTAVMIVLIVQFAQYAYAAKVSISWQNNPGGTTAGYKVYYGPASQIYDNNVDVGPYTEAMIDGLSSGDTYYFAVTAYDGSGNESPYSEEVQAVIPEDASSTSGSATSDGGGGGGCIIYTDKKSSAWDPLLLLLVTGASVRLFRRIRYSKN
jgi:hypothetical protein